MKYVHHAHRAPAEAHVDSSRRGDRLDFASFLRWECRMLLPKRWWLGRGATPVAGRSGQRGDDRRNGEQNRHECQRKPATWGKAAQQNLLWVTDVGAPAKLLTRLAPIAVKHFTSRRDANQIYCPPFAK